MNIEDIKVGETYKLELLCIYNKEKVVVFETPTGDHMPLRNSDHECVSPANGIKNTENAPKYDQNRMFRKGDIVRLREYNGRKPYDFWHKQVIKNYGAKLDTVLEDELDSGNVDIFQDAPIDELTVRVHSCHLELVTPVEELEPYRIGKSDYNGFVNIEKKGKIIAMIPYGKELHEHKTEEQALAAAEAERDRLNAEHRKEQA